MTLGGETIIKGAASPEDLRLGRSGVPGPSSWPRGVNLISTEGLGLLGVGEDGSLYYNGKLIEVRQSLVLTGLQKTIAGLAVAFAILGGFGSMLQGAVAAHQWACQNEATAWRCPKK